jgi:hypothetical protein
MESSSRIEAGVIGQMGDGGQDRFQPRVSGQERKFSLSSRPIGGTYFGTPEQMRQIDGRNVAYCVAK